MIAIALVLAVLLAITFARVMRAHGVLEREFRDRLVRFSRDECDFHIRRRDTSLEEGHDERDG